MIPLQRLLVLLAVAAFCDGLTPAHGQMITGKSGLIEVSVGPQQFEGIYTVQHVATNKTTNTAYSAVLLKPAASHPGVSIALTGDGQSIISLKHETVRLDKQQVCRVNAQGTTLTVFAGEIPLAAYANNDALKHAVTNLVAKAESAAP